VGLGEFFGFVFTKAIGLGDDISVQVSPTLYKELTRGLNDQNWFHGVLPRMMADSLISRNGQFLVRQSPNIDGQFVLVGMHDKKVKHVCLIGKDGKVSFSILIPYSMFTFPCRSKQPLESSGALCI
jgi:hypothetical protein